MKKKILIVCAVMGWQIHAISLDIYGGYNIAAGKAYSDLNSTFSTLNTAVKASGYTVTGSEPSNGGFAGGADLWFGATGFDIGVGLGYQPITNIDWLAKSGTSSVGLKGNVALIPVFAEARISAADFILGGGIGYGIGSGTLSSTQNGATVATSTLGGSVGGMMVMAGYNIVNTAGLKVGADLRIYLWLGDSTYYHLIPSVRAEFGF